MEGHTFYAGVPTMPQPGGSVTPKRGWPVSNRGLTAAGTFVSGISRPLLREQPGKRWLEESRVYDRAAESGLTPFFALQVYHRQLGTRCTVVTGRPSTRSFWRVTVARRTRAPWIVRSKRKIPHYLRDLSAKKSLILSETEIFFPKLPKAIHPGAATSPTGTLRGRGAEETARQR